MPILFGILIVAALSGTVGALIAYAIKSYNTPPLTHYQYTDKDILLFINNQVDGMVTAQMLADHSTLTKKQAQSRLNKLNYRGLLNASYTNSFKTYFSLKVKIKDRQPPHLSPHPFLSLGDLMILFKHYDYRLSIQDICVATNLPVAVIVSEMKYFVKEKIVEQISMYAADGMSEKSKFYLLQEPYRNNPKAYLDKEKVLDLNVKKLYERMVSGKSSS